MSIILWAYLWSFTLGQLYINKGIYVIADVPNKAECEKTWSDGKYTTAAAPQGSEEGTKVQYAVLKHFIGRVGGVWVKILKYYFQAILYALFGAG